MSTTLRVGLIRGLGDAEDRAVAVDLVGGPATLLEAVLLGRGERVFHLPGVAVNRAREEELRGGRPMK